MSIVARSLWVSAIPFVLTAALTTDAPQAVAQKAAPAVKKQATEARLSCRVTGTDAINVTIVNGTATDIAAGTKLKWTVGPGAKRCRATPVSEVVVAPGVLPPGTTVTLSVPDPRTPCATRCDAEFVK